MYTHEQTVEIMASILEDSDKHSTATCYLTKSKDNKD